MQRRPIDLKLPEEVVAAISSVEITHNKDGEKVTKVLWCSKIEALDKLCRHLGMYEDKLRIGGLEGELAHALPYAHLAATLTEALLLSGTPKKQKAAGSKGGLLREIGDFGILVLKDFTSILAMNRDQRGQLLAALREIFDGSWTRHVGVDGGRTLAWSGKLGLIAGCTAAIDSHHGVMSVMGERFLLYRLPHIEPEQQAKRATRQRGAGTRHAHGVGRRRQETLYRARLQQEAAADRCA